MQGKFKAALASAAIAAAFCTSAQAQDAVKIGFIGELSGPTAGVGQDQLDGFKLYLEDKGGKLGGVPIELLVEDSQFKPDVAMQVARRLVERDNVSVITGVSFSNVMMAIHKYITDRDVVLLSSNAGPSQIAGERCSPYQFVTSWQGDQAAEAVGKYAQEKGFKNIAVLAPNYQAGKDIVTGFKRYYTEPLAEEIYTQLTQLDFSAELATVAAAQPDAIFAFFPGGLGVAFAKQYAQAGMMGKVPLLTTFVVDALSLPAIGDGAQGIISGGFWAPDFDNAQSRKFVSDFEKKYGRIPSNYAAQSYDAAALLDSALGKVEGNVKDKAAFLKAMKAADFDSVRGDFSFGNNNFPVQSMHVMEVAKDDKDRLSLKTIATPLKNYQDAYHGKCPL
ncbi:ABC transporter substrate-binding protein [Pusillimonas sp. CC-YST705]|uniref:ABC transporter substrate-binding protein n=1 Tax=Mesopusillimonas faecipullorum TaxID=2755040 RepID=A0ABS8CDT0_9BURK|nr:ABC transporter substrate-binding protein [Mesopusillimonas faecipullorum]MCB5364188.1 ABC transporter substrate-binding protein [Mesopusillimonas faecipullorum]